MHVWVEVCTVASMSTRMPISIGSRKGLSAVVSSAESERVVLTSHGRPVAVVDTAERLDEDLRRIRAAADAVVDFATGEAARNAGKRLNLDEVCARIGVDADVIRERASRT